MKFYATLRGRVEEDQLYFTVLVRHQKRTFRSRLNDPFIGFWTFTAQNRHRVAEMIETATGKDADVRLICDKINSPYVGDTLGQRLQWAITKLIARHNAERRPPCRP